LLIWHGQALTMPNYNFKLKMGQRMRNLMLIAVAVIVGIFVHGSEESRKTRENIDRQTRLQKEPAANTASASGKHTEINKFI